MKSSSRALSLVATAAIGVGISIAAAPTTAQAVDLSVWDRVAACESGGNWSINTGNGFYGGLQFTHSTWLAYGGGAYASSAQYASKAEQIAIARRVLAGQGPGAWPVCGPRAGLTRTSGSASSSALPVGSTSVTVVSSKKTSTKKTTTKTTTVTANAKTATSAGTYRVAAGDTLSKIAKHHGTTWQKLWAKNKATISNPNVIRVGQVITL